MGVTVRVVILLLACGVGCFAVESEARSTKRPPRVLEGQLQRDEELWCSKLSSCTEWCSDCKKRQLSDLQQILDDCPTFSESEGYKHAINCPSGNSVCMCTEETPACRRCNPVNTTSQLVCFSQESGEAEIQIRLPNTRNLQPLSQTCPSCICSTDAPTTRPTTTRMLIPTVYHHEDDIDPRPTQKSMTTAPGNGQSNDVIIIAAATGGGVLAILLIVGCLICYCRRRRNKADKTENKETEYAVIDDVRTMRSQASMTSRQNLISNEGLNRLPCGHRHFNNEMYGINAIGNGSTISTQQQGPELPGNHPPPSVPPPVPSQYQGLNRGPMRSGSAMGNGPCPHCHQKSIPERSATAPLMDRPTGLDMSSTGVEGARNPYMALIKTNTCPTPGTPPAPLMCDCHSKPLIECSSASGSLQSDRQRNHSQAADVLNATTQDADQCQGGNGDAPEDPYYFKMQTAVDAEEVSPPQSPRYFKLEDAETIPLDGEDTPMLNSPDSNGNNVHPKTLPANMESVDTVKEPSSRTESLPQASLADGQSRSPTHGDNPVQFQSMAVSPDLATQSGNSKSVEGLPNGDYMHLVNGKSKVTSV